MFCLLLLLCVCVSYVCIYVCEWTWVCLWVHAGGQRRSSNVTSYFLPFFLRQALFIISHSISQALNIPGILPLVPLVSLYGVLDLETYMTLPGFPWVWGFEINSPHCTASILPTEPFPQPSYDCLDSHYKNKILI